MTPHDEPFAEDELDARLDALARGADPLPDSPTSRAYRSLSQFFAPAAAREAQAVERVRRRLLAHGAVLDEGSARAAPTEPATAPGMATPPSPTPALSARNAPRPGQPRRPRASLGGAARGCAAVLVVGALVGGFAVLLAARQGGLGAQSLTGYHWRRVPSPNTSLAVNALTGITVRTATDAWAWGVTNVAPTNTNSNPIQMPLVEHWDGLQWRIVATPQPTQGGQIADMVALAPDDAWAVGNQLTGGPENTGAGPLVEHWDGHSWTIRPDAVGDAANGGNGNLSALAALSADDIWAVGASSDPAGTAGLIEHWDGHAWQTVAHPAPPSGVQFNAITAVSPNDIWAVGSSSNKAVGPVFEHWDGRRWTIVPSPSPGGFGPVANKAFITAISAVSANDVWAAGFMNQAVPLPPTWFGYALFEHWDGHSWSTVPGPPISAPISAIVALGPDDVWAVGTESAGLAIDIAQNGHGVIAHWDGHVWSLVANPTPRPYTSLAGVAANPATPGTVWVAGTTGPQLDHGDQLSDTQTLIESNG